MANASKKLISAMHAAAVQIEQGSRYQWGHMGHCNCGHLAQELSSLSPAQIHNYAMESHGDWSEQASHYCDSSNMHIDLLIGELLSNGLELKDLVQLEQLSNPKVLAGMGMQNQAVAHNNKENAALYMRSWAELLELELV